MRTDEDYPYYRDPNQQQDAAERERGQRDDDAGQDEPHQQAQGPAEQAEPDDQPESHSPPAAEPPPAMAGGVALGGRSAAPREVEEDEPFDELGPDEHDAHLLDEEGADDEIYCPACGGTTYSDAPRCAQCGHWLSDADKAESGGGLRQIFTALVVALVTVALLLFLAMR